MKFGDRVIFTESGVDYSAIVLRQRSLDDYMGSNDEPLLDIGFFKPVMKADASGKLVEKDVVGTGDQSELVQFRIDVAHASHAFSEAAKVKYQTQYNGIRRVVDGKVENIVNYPGGRWKAESEEPVQGHVSGEDETALVPADGTYVEDSKTFSPGGEAQEGEPLVETPPEEEKHDA